MNSIHISALCEIAQVTVEDVDRQQQALSRPSPFRTASSKPDVDFDVVPAAGPPLWDNCGDAQMDDGAQIEPADWDGAGQPAPD